MNNEEFDLEETLRIFTYVFDSPTGKLTATLKQYRFGGGLIDWPDGERVILDTQKSFELVRKRFEESGYRLVATREIRR